MCSNILRVDGSTIIAETEGLDVYDFGYIETGGTDRVPNATNMANNDIVRFVYMFKKKSTPTCA